MMHPDNAPAFGVADQIVAFKRNMAPRRDVLKNAYDDVRLRHAAPPTLSAPTTPPAFRSTIPELAYADIKDGKVSDATRSAIRMTGCAVVRGVFPDAQATEWFDEVGPYLEDNEYESKEVEKAQPRQVFLGAEGRPAADLQRLLVGL